MAVIMNLRWAGITSEQYEKARGAVNWESDVPSGLRSHVCSFDGAGMRIIDVWDSGEQFNAFVEDRLMPVVSDIGFTGQPDVELLDVHRSFTP